MSTNFLANIPSLVNPDCNDGLMKPFSEIEILDVIWEMESDKAPGLDGFSFHFYRVCWNIIKSDLIYIVTAFQKNLKWEGVIIIHFLL